ncbi:MAG: histidine--tRNA ligase [Verrucomicrobia bacterium]|nr:MAG: histidine--tRNA ligase [Verrucomicrobiota bacterium]TAE89281.1 MAG: histidine--tRNA ligase [Verrucomicrobiota bacterium]TAF27845.1 MAG: histidine--tRNA ligase [Verrucomicrobiota bacterium]TAF42694.1 MAG: histidine--tRNA ligase [Verrucomicrobiota bacterium]
MAGPRFQALPGFRDFLPKDCATRNYLFETWRAVARRYGFVEYETPLLEDTALYMKKAGGELNSQLFRFEDQGGRDVTLRPEVTASLARLVAQHQRDFPKPLKWFEIGQCFRYEKPQKGRGREFFQFNVDILGESGPQADAELIALAIDTMLAFGFKEGDFVVRVSDRQAWIDFAERRGVPEGSVPEFLQIIDKLEREKPELSSQKLAALGISADEVNAFIANPDSASVAFDVIRAELDARGLGNYLTLDLSIVRGLAYYTGVVFEVFDAKKSMRAVAGGGRYDTLVGVISDGNVEMPATGFAMGDYVIRNLIEESPHAELHMAAWLQQHAAACDVFLVLADDTLRSEALSILGQLRRAGISCDLPFVAGKVNKQFQQAERSGARFALVIGSEFPELKLKALSSRSEESCQAINLTDWLVERLKQPDGPLLA